MEPRTSYLSQDRSPLFKISCEILLSRALTFLYNAFGGPLDNCTPTKPTLKAKGAGIINHREVRMSDTFYIERNRLKRGGIKPPNATKRTSTCNGKTSHSFGRVYNPVSINAYFNKASARCIKVSSVYLSCRESRRATRSLQSV